MYDHPAIELLEGEQAVHATHARIAPTLNEIIVIVLCAPVALVIWLFIHRSFRSVTYIITTRRVLIVEKQGIVDQIRIQDIQRVKVRRRAVMIFAMRKRLWLARLQNGWQFDTILTRVRALR
ncbi:hypothetical protein [Phaeobacter gallaeciensis]|uniref:Uncharacterized protein n=1 Tax=Phaeobacter gallaeciensis TaxID=60890 RepID=A0AAD0EBL3_9RHOB|nr:hypothetical protein [Phaeobacter gallaeciensis]AHD08102.1 hypothetical protein Gal_00303 [Phaeobacter gallaeciensis DSM 26640]ATE91368.1 hypothetical protein PhaeoP11_00301 [Phaeobacter gallaeciensis]ATE95644.1 hypothetical protein PhaeoP73_00302 [Phaeobacter gallaeciensis]ATE99983.1 hypothetical protein PhaeoP75_00302 [Phaeobacter gallaeciensis]ATF04416.1 hypothetical protein PhaeoP63_00302 [Phaeobacter gallaeciensis]